LVGNGWNGAEIKKKGRVSAGRPEALGWQEDDDVVELTGWRMTDRDNEISIIG